jgi:RNA polymerase sigma factor (sigma-70 family)
MSDGELLARFSARDELAERAFAVLVRRHGPMVLRVSQQVVGDRHTAEDAFQAAFLVLARRAGSIRQPEQLANWLHGVALRTAREARMRDVRRRRREAARPEDCGAEPIDETGRPDLPLVGREEFEALHDELSRLPEQYRAPVVLCDLEGLTYQEAARRLRCPVGTIGVRLMRARERLRDRLTRRGLAPMAGLLSALLGADADSACASPGLVDSTVSAAMRFAASAGGASAVASVPVVSLAEAVLKTMALARLKPIIGVTMTVGFATALGWFAWHRMAAIPAPAVQPAHESTGLPPRAAIAMDPADAKTPPTIAAPRAGSPADLPPVAFAAIDARPTAQPKVDSSKPDRFGDSTRKRDAIAKISPGQKVKPEPAAVPSQDRPVLRDDEARGSMLFAKEWTPDDPMSSGGDGLGPVYNDTSCVACHGLGAPGGAGPESKNVVIMTAVPGGCAPSTPLDQIHPGFRGSRSAVLHHHGTDPEYAEWRNQVASGNQKQPSRAAIDSFVTRIRAIRDRTKPEQRMRERSRDATAINGVSLSIAERNTPPLFGIGQIDEVPEGLLVALAANQPERVRGRVSRTANGRAGRFGWKAQIATLQEFVRAACANELGLEVPGKAQAPSPIAPLEKAPGLDLTEPDCNALVAYVRSLPAPVVVDPFGPQGSADMRDGRRIFDEIGCATCHVPSLGEVRGVYSDLLLHNMGQSLSNSGGAYGGSEPDSPGAATAREWRTPPLWGYRDSGPYLHDGRAQNLEEAVALHDGQGRPAARRFFELSSQERSQVESFLKSLVAPTAAAAPGVMLAAEMERRIEPDEPRIADKVVPRRPTKAAPHNEKEWRSVQRWRLALEAARRARVQIPIAESLEKMGKTAGALNFYRDIARQAAGTKEGQLAAERISALSAGADPP